MKVPLLAVSVLAGSMLTPAQAQLTSRTPIVNSKTPVATKAPALPSDHTPSNLLGGSDDCSTPEGIAGPGPHSFNNTAATTGAQGQANANCNFFGQTGITNDVWFSWTAPGSGAATLTMCGQGVTIDTKVAIYDGSGCPGAAAIACNDDFCGLQSQVGFTAVGGNAYTFQVGNFPGATAGSGTFTVTVSGVQTNDDCSTPTVIAGSGPHPFDTTAATTGAQGQNNANCLFFGSPGIANDLWYTWQAPSNDTFSLKTCNMTGVDSKVAVYDGAGCPVAAAIACNDDFCGLQSTLSFTGVAGNNYHLHGQLPPCPTCHQAMRTAAQQTGANITYSWGQPPGANSITYPGGVPAAGAGSAMSPSQFTGAATGMHGTYGQEGRIPNTPRVWGSSSGAGSWGTYYGM
jgi:hypothetical protein